MSDLAELASSLSEKIRRAVLRLFGWHVCPCCSEQSVRWNQVVVYDPEEPPMFGYWFCRACGARTKILPTGITEKALQDLGYRDFDEWHEAALRAHLEADK